MAFQRVHFGEPLAAVLKIQESSILMCRISRWNGLVFEAFTQWLIRFVLEKFATVSHLCEDVIKSRNDKHPNNRPDKHSADGRSADGTISDRARACSSDQWNHAGDKGK